MPKESGPAAARPALPKPGQSSRDFVREYTYSLLEQKADAENLIRSVGKMDAMAEMEIARLRKDPSGQVACKPGCDHCCYRIVGVGISELIQIGQRVATRFSPSERERLLDRCRQYATATFPYRSGRENLARPACPFLVDHQCSIYDVRPLGCRGMNSRSAAACEAKRRNPETAPNLPLDARQNAVSQWLSDAQARALHAAGLAHHYVDLGLALPDLLAHPELVDRYLEGEQILLEHSLVAPGPDPIREDQKRAGGNIVEPSGYPPPSAMPGHPVFEFLRLGVPNVFSSQEAIDRSLARYRRMIDEFVETPMDPGRAFDGLSQLQTIGLAYTGEDVTEILRTVGSSIVNPVVARALPDLVEPIEPRRPEGKLRVGYLSPNMFAHNATISARGLISNHAEDIETFVIHVGPASDPMTLQFRAMADHFYHLPGDVPSSARFIKNLRLDVLIFPDIGDPGKTFQYAGMRLAPVQCTTWGQPVTSGLSTIDYFLSGELMEPENGNEHYVETLVRLPGSGLHWLPPAPQASTKSREELGLPEGPFYFVGQNVRKLVPRWDFLYAEIQARTGAPIVFVEFGVEASSDPTPERLEKAGVKATWIPTQPLPDFLRIQQLCTLNLDPPAWNGGITTLLGLAEGGPLVTLPGPFMRSRFGSAFMKQANVGGLIASSPEEYVSLATDYDRIHEVMKGLQPKGMFRDPAAPAALDDFLRRVAGRG